MAYGTDIRRPGLGGINNDVIDSELSVQDTRYVKNAVRFMGKDGLMAVVRNIKGNTQVAATTTAYFSSAAKVIGKCRDEQNDGLIAFVADATNGDAIIEYYPKTDTVEFIIKNNVPTGFSLNFDKTKLIKGAYVIDGLLYWNDNNGLHKVNITKAKNYLTNVANGNTALSPAYSTMDDQTISLIKYPYLDRINPYYDTDTTRSTNNLRGYLFQFRVEYIYDDNEVSVASPISPIAIPWGSMDITGEVVADTSLNNVLSFALNTGHQTVAKIAVYVRIGNNGDWVLTETIDKSLLGLSDNAIYTYSFYNDNVTTGVNQVQINQLYHAVPLQSDYLAYIHTNQLLPCGNTDGYDNINTDVTLTPSLNEPTNKVSAGTLINAFDVVYVAPTTTEKVGYWRVDFSSGIPAANTLVVVTIDGNQQWFVVTAAEAGSAATFKTDLISFIATSFSLSVRGSLLDINGAQQLSDYQIAILAEYLTSVTVTNNDVGGEALNAITGYKAGSDQSLCVFYYDDAGRMTFAQPIGKVYLPFITESTAVFPPSMTAPYSNEVVYSIKWAINHLPPQWATRWGIGRQADLTLTYFQQYIINGITAGTSGWDDDKTYIDISPLNLHKSQYNTSPIDFSFPNSSINAYTFQKGDRIRFITQKRDYTTDPAGLGPIVAEYLDMEILGYQQTSATDTTNTNQIMVQSIDTTKYSDIGQFTLAEIYRPNKQKNDMLYYETGEMFKVAPAASNASVMVHTTIPAGATAPTGTDQDVDGTGAVTQAAEGESVNGDIYIVPLIFDINLTSGTATKPVSLIENQSASVFYDQPYYNIGRTNVVDKNASQIKTLSLRLSGKLFENSYINNLSQFYGGSDLYVSKEWGDSITGVVENGYTLKVIQPRKTTSFYVGRTGLQLASVTGIDQIVANSDASLATQSPSPLLRGSMNSESILKVENLVFYVDVLNGSIVQDSENGVVNIERYGIIKDVKAICDSLLNDYPSYEIYSAYDPVLNMVAFSFQGINTNGTVDDKGTFFYDYSANKWSHVYYYGNAGDMPVSFASIDQYHISFLKGQIWKHHTNTVYNNFYGNQLSAVVELVFNKNYGTPKLFKSLQLIGQGTWAAKAIGDVLIEAKNNVNGIQQESRLLKGRFNNIRGKKTAYFLKNANTKGTSNQIESLRTGDDLKGNILFLRLTSDDTTEAFVDTAMVNYQILGQ